MRVLTRHVQQRLRHCCKYTFRNGIWSVVSGTGSADSISPTSTARGLPPALQRFCTDGNQQRLCKRDSSITINIPAVVNARRYCRLCRNFSRTEWVLGGAAKLQHGRHQEMVRLMTDIAHCDLYPGANDVSVNSVVLMLTTNDPAGMSYRNFFILHVVYAIPAAPVANNMSACSRNYSSTNDNRQQCEMVFWCDLSPVGNGNCTTLPQTAIGAYTYYATQSVNRCASPANSLRWQ